MAVARSRRHRKPANRYHHGDLRRALIEEAVRTIQVEGVEHLTLRAIGERLGVSRTALYRHFSDKQALLAAVSGEGFRMFRVALARAWEARGGGRDGLTAMGAAYVEFAVTHSSHYRVMFGRFLESCEKDPAMVEEAKAAFQTLVDAVVALQQAGLARQDDPVLLSTFIWSVMHGIAMLVIDGQLAGRDDHGEALYRYTSGRLREAIAAD